MQTRAIVGSALAIGLFASLGFAACRSRQPAPPPQPPVVTTSTPPMTASTAVPIEGFDAGQTPEQAFAERARQARNCAEPVASILNQPDGGVVFNNAMTSVDAGFIDRTRGVLDALGAHAASFRCCFDAYLRANPTDEARVMLRVTLAADGAVEAAEIDAKRSTLADPLTSACLVALARDASYPASPTEKQTIVEYPIVVGSK